MIESLKNKVMYMKLFDGFEAIKFIQENLIFITHNGYLYYIYKPKYNYWEKYDNAGNVHITVANYPSVTREELISAMKGCFPEKETDFMRMCNPSQLCIRDVLDLLKEDYTRYMSDYSIYRSIHRLLLRSDICHKSFVEIKKLLDKALELSQNESQVYDNIKELCFKILGKDIFKKEIRIVDYYYGSSCFGIRPVRVVKYSDADHYNNVVAMSGMEISIEEDDIDQYLTPFLYKYFDDKLEANKNRSDANGFEWYLTHNFFTFSSITNILADIKDTIDALSTGRENEFTSKLKEKRGYATYQLLYAKNLTKEQIEEYNANRPKEDDTEIELIIDFYNRFIYRMEYMLKVGKENGYDLISFMGP